MAISRSNLGMETIMAKGKGNGSKPKKGKKAKKMPFMPFKKGGKGA